MSYDVIHTFPDMFGLISGWMGMDRNKFGPPDDLPFVWKADVYFPICPRVMERQENIYFAVHNNGVLELWIVGVD